MIRVRWMNGVCCEYDADWLQKLSGGVGANLTRDLYKGDPDKGGRLIVSIPPGCIVEFEPPAQVFKSYVHATDEQNECVRVGVKVLVALEKMLRKINGVKK